MVELELLLNEWYKTEIKNRPSSTFDRLDSIFHYYTTPLLHHFLDF